MLYFLSVGVAPQYGMAPPVDKKQGKKKKKKRVILSADSKGEGNMSALANAILLCRQPCKPIKKELEHTQTRPDLSLSLSQFVS